MECDLPPGSIIFEPDERANQKWGAHAETSLLELNNKRFLGVPLDNPTGFTISIQAGEVLGSAAEAAVIQSQEEDPPQQKVLTARVSSEEASGREKRRQEKLKETIGDLNLPDGERETLMSFLLTYHNTFCLDERCAERRTSRAVSYPLITSESDEPTKFVLLKEGDVALLEQPPSYLTP